MACFPWRRWWALNPPNRRGTDPYARWCGRGGIARCPPIPIEAPRALPDHEKAKRCLTAKTDFFSAFDALAVDDRGGRTSLSVRQFPALHIKRVVQTVERAVIVPAAEVIVQRATRRQIFGDRRPLAARGQNIHQSVDDLALDNRPLVATSLGAWDQRSELGPLFVRHVTRIAQLAAVIAGTVFIRPYQAAPANRCATY
jgi:hypothetical protein